MAKNWIRGAIRHPNALRESLHIPRGRNIPRRRLTLAARKPGLLGRRARLALTLAKLRRRR